jgi:hypothetical protein
MLNLFIIRLDFLKFGKKVKFIFKFKYLEYINLNFLQRFIGVIEDSQQNPF